MMYIQPTHSMKITLGFFSPPQLRCVVVRIQAIKANNLVKLCKQHVANFRTLFLNTVFPSEVLLFNRKL